MGRVSRSAGAVCVAAVVLMVLRTHAQVPSDGSATSGQAEPQAPSAAGQAPTPTFRGGINFVRVDVLVSDKQGHEVADLKQTDFEVTEDGKPQTVETFKLVRLDESAPLTEGPPKAIRTDYDEESEAARDDVRLFAIFLDDYHVRRESSMVVRERLASFVENQLSPSDMVGVMYPLEPLAEVRMIRDRAATASAMRQFAGRKFEYTPRNEMEWRYADQPTAVVEQIRNEVSLSALKGLVIHMGSLKEGRKAVILVSEGYTGLLPPQLRGQNALMGGADNPQRDNPFAGMNDRLEDMAQFSANLDLQAELRSVYDAANRNNTAIYAVDPRGLTSSEFGITSTVNPTTDQQYLGATIDTLRQLAENTDGRAIVNSNDVLSGMKQIVRDSSAYYLLGYTSSQTASDGKFHEIKVRVKRTGVQVRSRKGYWALTPSEAAASAVAKKSAAGPPPAVTSALSSIAEPARDRVVRTWIGTSRGENGRTKVTFVWEPVPKIPGDRSTKDEPVRVSLMAAGADGAQYFRGRVPDVALASAAPSMDVPDSTPRAPSRITFEAPPGTMHLRVSVEGRGSEVLDSEVRDVAIPDLTLPQAALGTPAVLRGRTARELQQLKADPDAVPVATREFSRADRLLIRVPAYGPADGTLTVTARLLSRDGKPMMDLPVGIASGAEAQIDLPLAGLAAGQYLVEIAAGTDASQKQLVGFRVTS
jgi:VWFA-related protein